MSKERMTRGKNSPIRNCFFADKLNTPGSERSARRVGGYASEHSELTI
jgi:hypothetical protein